MKPRLHNSAGMAQEGKARTLTDLGIKTWFLKEGAARSITKRV